MWPVAGDGVEDELWPCGLQCSAGAEMCCFCSQRLQRAVRTGKHTALKWCVKMKAKHLTVITECVLHLCWICSYWYFRWVVNMWREKDWINNGLLHRPDWLHTQTFNMQRNMWSNLRKKTCFFLMNQFSRLLNQSEVNTRVRHESLPHWIISRDSHELLLCWFKELSLFITHLIFETDLLIMSVWENYELQNQLRVIYIREKLYPKNIANKTQTSYAA